MLEMYGVLDPFDEEEKEAGEEGPVRFENPDDRSPIE